MATPAYAEPPAWKSSVFRLAAPSTAQQVADAVVALMTSTMSDDRRSRLAPLRVGVVPRGTDIIDGAVAALAREGAGAPGARLARWLDAARARHAGALAVYRGARRTTQATRGVTFESKGLTYCFAGEENVLAERWDEHGSRARRILVHEIGHAVESLALDHAEAAALRASYAANLRRRGLAAAREELDRTGEFFAESTEAWFGVHQSSPGEAGRGPDFIRARLPELAALFESVFGPPR